MRNISLLIIALLFIGCSNKVQQINYAQDACDFCRMSIVDKAHASQLVSDKGKNFKFDAIECMLHYMGENPHNTYSHMLVAVLTNPGELIDANKATYIISKDIPSPMGASLSAVRVKSDAQKIVEQQSGEIYSWNEIFKKFSKK